LGVVANTDRASAGGLAPDSALDEAARLLDARPDAALARAEAVLAAAPDSAKAELIACSALRRLGRPDEVRARIEALTRRQPQFADGWFLLAAELRRAGRAADAWRADLSGVRASGQDPELVRAAIAMHEGRFADGEAVLEGRLARQPDDAVAWRLAGEMRWRQGDMDAALTRVERAVALAPGFDLARHFLIRLLLQTNRLAEALEHAEVLAESPLASPGNALLRASVLVRLGEQERAADIYRAVLKEHPAQPEVWQNLGHVLKTLGQQAEAIDAYRQAVRYRPTMGEAWWSLANLKTVKLGPDDIAAMEQALHTLESEMEPRQEDVFHLHFSLGKAHEDRKDHAASFRHYAEGNRRRRAMVRHDADGFSAEVEASIRTFTPALAADMGPGGCPAPDPIFIVGLPRSGSTLVEQILASHSQIEGTMELPEMMMIAGRLQSRVDEGEFPDFDAMIRSLTAADRLRLGEEYIDRTRVHRRTDKPLFIDKMPNNWQHVGLIRLILPHAKIIDARRHPMSCCFSGWKQHFARGQAFSYDLADIGRYYVDYVRLMAANDRASPGSVHRVIYERMVADTEREVRRLLDHLGLPFEPACLEFYNNDRAVRTASSEQVRRPIFTDGLDQWRNYEPWLGPLVAALGPVLSAYPEAPAF
jgi:predicted Zn-dependent protease